ncbi:homocysteine S-methyltransferase family protein [Micromonospora sp. WMMD1128]|uniref:homocysteine S-methyltransferase family protein n=1 Tax=unclassified Micromonospora TaxID=2617518 RepID=UPI00248C2B54|nr:MULTISPECIES: homocysteine S-methyltransferase family protein [unclassified Micromonospora]WBB75830.1 homocysteine S-methyltransferase family protein [Micromonospora sp. WMMD1128]WFE36380.1 homocysteine S-methyltransferase family protein [Micromonospora sp. WMMD975]
MGRLTDGSTIRLDGGVATELHRAGMPLSPPWWMTRALLSDERRRVLRGVHERFLAAGADVITANTFRCNLRALQAAGLTDAGLGWMVHAAVGVALAARNAAGGPRTRVVASIAPVADAYRPDLVPDDDTLRVEHRWLATELSRAGVDTMLIETMNTAREARAALAEVLATGATAWVGFVCGDDARLLSGEPLVGAARAVLADGAEAVLVNCTDPARTEECLRALRAEVSGPVGAYPNLEGRDGDGPALDPKSFGELMARWRDEYDLALAGGCCGTTPEHLAAMTDRFGA